jgi:8-oxo-dGTP pyrophosphatase MutT (NUDIX family)
MVRAFSAGGVVFRFPPNTLTATASSPSHAAAAPAADRAPADPLAGIEIALVGRTHAGVWALPKGTPRHGEGVSETALREVREETGLNTRIVGELGSIYYTFTRARTRYRKEVAHFLLEATGGDVADHDAEYDAVRWFPLHEALEHLTFANDADVVRRAQPLLAQLRTGAPTPDAASAALPVPPAGGATA